MEDEEDENDDVVVDDETEIVDGEEANDNAQGEDSYGSSESTRVGEDRNPLVDGEVLDKDFPGKLPEGFDFESDNSPQPGPSENASNEAKTPENDIDGPGKDIDAPGLDDDQLGFLDTIGKGFDDVFFGGNTDKEITPSNPTEEDNETASNEIAEMLRL
jgi:hypothetical protein